MYNVEINGERAEQVKMKYTYLNWCNDLVVMGVWTGKWSREQEWHQILIKDHWGIWKYSDREEGTEKGYRCLMLWYLDLCMDAKLGLYRQVVHTEEDGLC